MNSKQLKSYLQRGLSFRPGLKEIPILLQGLLIALLFGRLFYDSWIAVALLSPLAIFWYIYRKKAADERNVRIVGIQFRDAIASVLTNLKAGYSVENAFVEALRDMELLYGKKSLIAAELSKVKKGLANNIPIEKLLFKVGRSTGNSDIQDFASVFAVAKRSGGNMTEVIGKTITVISQKIDVEKEIEVLISAKKMEARIMNLVPFFIIFYIDLTSPGFFTPLYHNIFGMILMSLCMGFYIFAYFLSERIVNIHV